MARADREACRHAVRSARQSALGRRAGEGANPGEQLAFGDRPALLDLDSSLAGVLRVVGPDVIREVLDDLAVPDREQVVLDRQHAGDVIEKGPHVFVAMAFAARVLLGRWSSGRAVPAGDRRVDAVAHG